MFDGQPATCFQPGEKEKLFEHWLEKTKLPDPIIDQLALLGQSYVSPLLFPANVNDDDNDASHIDHDDDDQSVSFGRESSFWNWYIKLNNSDDLVDPPLAYSVDLDFFAEESKHLEYENYLKWIERCQTICDHHLESIASILTDISNSQKAYQHALKETLPLYHLANGLFKEKRELEQLINYLDDHLYHFETPAYLAKKLDSVHTTQDGFMPLFDRLSESSCFFQKNSSIPHAQLLLTDLVHLEAKAIALLKNYITSTFKQILAPPNAQVSNEPHLDSFLSHSEDSIVPSSTTQLIQIKNAVPHLKQLCTQIEARAEQLQYKGLLSHIRHVFFQARKSTLQPTVQKHISSLLLEDDLFQITRNGCLYLINLSKQEHKLYHLFFTQRSDELLQFLQDVSSLFHQYLLPIILRISDIHVLCKLIYILRSEVGEAYVTAAISTNKDEGNVGTNDELLPFKLIINQMVEDIQDRLILVAETFMRNKIEHFDPSSQNLDYPNILLKAYLPAIAIENHQIYGNRDLKDEEKVQQDVFHMINHASNEIEIGYPPLVNTVELLSKLHLAIHANTFNSIALDAVSLCIKNMCQASKVIAQRRGGIDASLFLIKYIEILQENILPFNLNFIVVEKMLDFSSSRNLLSKLMTGDINISNIFSFSANNAFFWMIQSVKPKISYLEKDLKKNLETIFSQMMEYFILIGTQDLVGRIINFVAEHMKITQLSNQINMDQKQSQTIDQDSFQLAKDVIDETKCRFKIILPKIICRLNLYLKDRINQDFLFNSIKGNIIDSINDFNTLVSKIYPDECHSILLSKKEVIQQLDDLFLSGTIEEAKGKEKE